MRRAISILLALCWFSARAADVAGIGDSIMRGACHDPDAFYSQIQYGAESGDTNMSPMHILAWISGGTLTTTNIGYGNYKWWNVRSNSMSWIQPGTKWVIAHCGVNDIAAGWTWQDAATNINAIKAYCDALGARFILDEIFPCALDSDSTAATVRQWNLYYHEWAATNSSECMTSHDLMGAYRAATGFYDNLNTSYDCNYDGVHLSQLGVAVWTTNILNYVNYCVSMSHGAQTVRAGTARMAP